MLDAVTAGWRAQGMARRGMDQSNTARACSKSAGSELAHDTVPCEDHEKP